MKRYIVGGWVRDTLLKEEGFDIAPQDKDWVVVGASPEEMVKRGFIPVGADFPVFIDPKNGEELALARTERKSGKGYHGFVFHADPSVTLEEDLLRRDLTINAMAFDEDGSLIDCYGGKEDLKNRVLRHISDAFVEDPVRLLRVARFSARLSEFSIAPETMTLLQTIVSSGESDNLVQERVTQEFLRALEESKPSRFFEVLRETGYLERAFPAWKLSPSVLAKVDEVKSKDPRLKRFVASLEEVPVQDLNKILKALRLPKEYSELAVLAKTYEKKVPKVSSSSSEKLLFLKKTDSLRRPERFKQLLDCYETDLSKDERDYWEQLADAVRQLDLKEIVAKVKDKKDVPKMVDEARCLLIEKFSK
ncbi:tRNA nucleotidyltransferase [Turicimonas muris]|uniref:tRNA nucleotidyltransferase n=1 Tax=Turicimonas muris TaxID=1796652 RepID=UPI0023F21C30|nr:tRNA nucleotidyltransferase [Turicimonas muris]